MLPRWTARDELLVLLLLMLLLLLLLLLTRLSRCPPPFTVKCPDPCTAADLEKQAAVYAAVARACLDQPACTSFETWGFTDGVSWLNGARCHPPGLCHPLPFDANYLPKPAAEAILGVLQKNHI